MEVDVGENTIKITVMLGSGTRDYFLTVTRNSTGEPLTATLVPTPWRDSGLIPEWHFELLLSEPPDVGNQRQIEAALVLSNAEIDQVVRVSGRQWRIRVAAFNALDPVEVSLEADRACGTAGALCSTPPHYKPLSNAPSLEFPAWGYTGPPIETPTLRVENSRQPENQGRLTVDVGIVDEDGDDTSLPYPIELRMRTVGGGTATEGVDYHAADERIVIDPNEEGWEVDLIDLITDGVGDADETVKVELSEAWVVVRGLRVAQMEIEQRSDGGSTLLSTGKTVVATITITEPVTQSGRH